MVHPADRGSLEALWRIRQELRDTLHQLGDTVADAPVADFFGHITLAYVTDDLSGPRYARVKAVLSPFENLPLGGLTADRLELRRFDSMVQWPLPLAILALTEPTPRRLFGPLRSRTGRLR